MLMALGLDGIPVWAHAAHRDAAYHCPACGAPLLLKQGAQVTPHFAHHPQAPCSVSSEPESATHLAMKRAIHARFAAEPQFRRCTVEQVIGQQRADVWLETAAGSVAIECQVSPLTVADLARKLAAYTAARVATLYLVHDSVLATLAEGTEVRVPAWVLGLHALQHGRVYISRADGTIVPVHLAPVLREPRGYSTHVHRLRSTRRIVCGPVVERLDLHVRIEHCRYGALAGATYAIALFGDGVFWQ